MSRSLRLLIVEDSENDAELTVENLRSAGYAIEHLRVDTPEAMRRAMMASAWDLVISDFTMPGFDASGALRICRESGQDIPFIVVSGSIGEETAVAIMKGGAHDYILKDNLTRLVPAVQRELREAELRREHQRVEDQNHRMEQELRQSERHYRMLFNGASDAIFILGFDGSIFEANEVACERLGYTRAEVTRVKLADIIAPEFRMLMPSRIGEIRRRGHAVFESMHLRRGGGHVPVEINARLIDYGGAEAMLSIARDISERRQAEEALRESEERFRTIFEDAPIGMASFDAQFRMLKVNRALCRMLGYSEQELTALTFTEFTYQEDVERDLSLAGQLFRGEIPGYKLEKRFVRKDEQVVWALVTATLIREHDGKIRSGLGMIEDITPRKRIEEQFFHSQKLEAVGQLAGGIAHDFNNLLTAINGYSEISLLGLKADHPLRGNLEEIRKAGERAASLTRQLLAFSRKQVLQPKVLDLNDVVADMDKMLRRLIGEDIDLRTVLEPELGRVLADRGQLEQMIVNLVVNARDAMPRGGKLTIELANVYLDEEYASRHVSIKPGTYVRLCVHDTGEGMTPEVQKRIFEPFFTTKEAGKGTGLGLSTAYGLVKQSGGSIWVYSEPGIGTTFKVYLPCVHAAGITSDLTAEKTSSPGGTETILLVEDDEAVRRMVIEILRVKGYKLIEASKGPEAVEFCLRNPQPIHLVLTDVVMPGMNGRQVVDRLTALRPGLKVLYMSGYTDDSIVLQGVLEEGVAFIEKPFTPAALARRVREVLDG
ncbi:MAG: PAS domain S-box protein [Acidobacteria bacterium]|nr:PAS domain S-box protein [Acidobacteriota bacterium]